MNDASKFSEVVFNFCLFSFLFSTTNNLYEFYFKFSDAFLCQVESTAESTLFNFYFIYPH